MDNIINNKAFCLAFLLLLTPTTSLANTTEPDDYLDLSLESLMDIVVTSVSKREEKAFEASSAVYVITQEDIRRSGATSIPEALRMVPGVQVARIDSNKWAISARGANRQFSNKLLVLMDGRSVYTPLFSGVYWDVQDTVLEDIERIEVIRGPGATLWGANAVNGVINIITKDAGDTQGALISAGAGNHESFFATSRYGGELSSGGHYRVYTKYNKKDEFEKISGADANDDWDIKRGGFRIDTDKNQENIITFQGDIYDGEKDYPLTVPIISSPFSESSPDEDTDFHGGNLLVNWVKDVSEHSDTTLQVYYDYIERNIPVLGQRRQTFDFDFQHDWIANDSNHVVWGAGYRYISDELVDSAQVNYDVDSRSDKIFSAFLQDKITIHPDDVFLTLGSKFERNDYTGFEFQPSARIAWLIDEDRTLWSSVARSVRTPSRNEDDIKLVNLTLPDGFLGAGIPAMYASQIGNRDIESEKMMAYEIGYRFKPIKRTMIDVSAFYNDYDNLRTTESPGAPFVDTSLPTPTLVLPLPLGNKGSGESYGVEIAGSWNVNENWKLFANYTFLTMSLHVDSDSGDTSLESDEGKSPHNQLHVRSYLNLPHNIEWDNLFYYVDNLSDADIDSYMRFDTRIGWRPSRGVAFSIAGQNLFDDNHKEFNESIYSTTSEIGRSVYGKVTLDF